MDLCELADIRPSVGLIGELVNSDGSMKRLRDCTHFAKQHDIKMITVEQLADYRRNKLGHSIGIFYYSQWHETMVQRKVMAV